MKWMLDYFEKNKIIFLVLGLVSYVFAYFSKSTAIVFLALFPLVLYFFTNARPKKIITLTGMILIIVIASRILPKHFLPHTFRAVYYFENPLFYDHNIWHKAATGLYGLLIYIKLLIIPHPLVFYYGFNTIPITNFSDPLVIISLALHLGMFSYAIFHLKEKHLLSFAILFYLISISMFANIIKPVMGILGERFLYAPSLGFAIIIGYFIFKLLKLNITENLISRKHSLNIILVSFLILIPYSIRTIIRNKDWKDSLTLMRHDIKYLEKSAKANSLLALFLSDEINKTIDEDEKIILVKNTVIYYEAALKIYPDYSVCWNNLGMLKFLYFSDYAEAKRCYKEALRVNPGFEEAHMNLGAVYEKTNDRINAINEFKKVVAANPERIQAYSGIASIYFKNNDFVNGTLWNEKIKIKTPNSDIPYINLGNYYYFVKGDTSEAILSWETAIKKNPSNVPLCNYLSNYFRLHHDDSKAQYYSNISNSTSQ